MDWLILLVLVPAILVPVVLLCGFAGCSYNPSRGPSTAFDVATVVPEPIQTAGPADYCFVHRIPAGQLLAGGPKIRITLHGSPANNVAINNISVSRAAGSGNLWDSAADLAPVLTSVLTLSDDQTILLDPIDYVLDENQDLLIAFDFTATLGADNLRFVLQPGVTLYFKQGTQQALRKLPEVRDLDFFTSPEPRLYFVETIIV